MGKVVIGVVLGLVLAGAIFLLFDPESRQEPVADSTRVATDSVTETRGLSPEAVTTDQESSALEPEQPVVADAPPQAEQGAPTNEEESVFPAEDDPVVLPIPGPSAALNLPSAVNPLEGDGVAPPRKEIEREPIDPLWAPTTEAQFYSFYSERPEIYEEYGTPTVYCRTTLCEIQVVTSRDSSGNWLNANAPLFDQDWASQFGEEPMGYGFSFSTEGDVVTILQWVKRGEPQQVQSLGSASALN